MPTSGDVWLLDLGNPIGSEAGFLRPAVVVTAQIVLSRSPTVVHVVPVTSTRRSWPSEVDIDPDPENGLTVDSAIQCQHVRSISTERLTEKMGNVGPVALAGVRGVLADLMDL